MSAEQFGTNLRATAAISIHNLVRGFLPLILLLFQFLRSQNVFNDYVTGAWVTRIIIRVTGFYSCIICERINWERHGFYREINKAESSL
jgi:hypothetical protein